MGNFIEQNLIPGEKIIYKAEVHWMVYYPAFLNLFLAVALLILYKFIPHANVKLLQYLALVPIFVAAWKAVQAYCHRQYTEIAITNDRLVVKFGVVARETIELPLPRIESVIVDQTINERMIDAGSIAVRGVGISVAPIRYIEHPFIFRNHLNEAIAQAKQAQ